MYNFNGECELVKKTVNINDDEMWIRISKIDDGQKINLFLLHFLFLLFYHSDGLTIG